MKRFKQLFFIFLGFCLVSTAGTAMGDDTTTVKEMLVSKVNQVIKILKRKDITDKEKKEQVVKIITPMFDFNLMAKLCLGKRHWMELSTEKQKEFTNLFVKRLKNSYIDKLSFYNGQTMKYGTPISKKRIILMPSTIVSKDNQDNISMLYKFWHSPKGWKIYDIEVEGISIIKTYRSQFNQVLRNKTIDYLLQELRKSSVEKPAKDSCSPKCQ